MDDNQLSEQQAASSKQQAALSFLTPYLLGGVLLTAALFKIQRLWTDSSSASGIFDSTWFQVVLIESELACGFALWLTLWPRVVRWVAMLMFAAFFGAALSQGLGGARSCACFGNVQLHPWFAVVLDLVLLAALFYWKPKPSESAIPAFGASPNQRTRRQLVMGGGFGMLMALSAAFLMAGSGPAVIAVEPGLVDFKVLNQGQRARAELSVINRTGRPFVIGRTESSCTCLTLRINGREILPGQRMYAELLLDMSHEPTFVGGLLMTVTAFDEAGEIALTIRAKARVKPNALGS